MERASRSDSLRHRLPIVLAIVLPWCWFAVRDVGGALDTVAVGLPLVGVVAIVVGAIVAVLSGRAWPLFVGTSVFAVCAVSVLGPRLPRIEPAPEPAIRLVAANVWDANPTPGAVPDSMFDRPADVVAAVEMPGDAF